MLRKMLRDMKLYKTQFISIFLLAFLGAYIYAGVTSEYNGLNTIANDLYKSTNMANVWVYSMGFSKEAAEEAAKVEGVTEVERRLTLQSIADLDNNPTVKLHFVEDNKISKFKLIEGEPFSLNSKDGIWLDSLFGKERNLKLGDKISLSTNGLTFEKTIKGFIMSPEYVYYAGENDIVPDRTKFGYGILSYQAFPEGIPITYTDLLITTKKAPDIELENAIDQALAGKYTAYITRESFQSYMQFHEEMQEHKAVGKLFPIVFLAVAVLTSVTTMTRLVNNQRTQIGILKAVGFKRRKILFHYVSYGLWIGLVSATLGAILGPLTLPYLFYEPMKTTFTLPEWYSIVPVSVIYMVIATVLCCTIATYITCRKVLQDTPAQSLRPKAPKDIKHSVFDRLKIWKRLSFDTQWNLRDVLRCKGRSLMAIFGVFGCSALLICAFGMQDTMDYIVKWNYEILNRYNTMIVLQKDVTTEQAAAIMDKVDGESIRDAVIELKANGKKKSGELLVTDEVTLIQAVDQKNNLIELPEDQISISYKMAENLGLKVGDEISWHIFGEVDWKTTKIGAIYRTPFAQGITMTKAHYETYGYTYQPSTIITAMKQTEGKISLETEGVSKIQSRDEMISNYEIIKEAMDVYVYTLVFAAIILATVVIYNLSVLSFTERQRELSTLKVIGFKTKKLRNLLMAQNIWLTIIGIILGMPVGFVILYYIFQFVGEVFDFYIIINFSSYLYCIAGTMFVSILMNRLFSKKVKNIDMVSSLKGVE